MKLDEAIKYCQENEAQRYYEVTELRKRQDYIGSTGRNPKNCYANTIKRMLEDAHRYNQLASLLTELKERREAVKKLEDSAEYYNDSLYGDGIRFALKVIGEPRKRDWESEEENKIDNLPSCNNCIHNGTWDCIKCSGFDRYERSDRK